MDSWFTCFCTTSRSVFSAWLRIRDTPTKKNQYARSLNISKLVSITKTNLQPVLNTCSELILIGSHFLNCALPASLFPVCLYKLQMWKYQKWKCIVPEQLRQFNGEDSYAKGEDSVRSSFRVLVLGMSAMINSQIHSAKAEAAREDAQSDVAATSL